MSDVEARSVETGMLATEAQAAERYYLASQWTLMRRRFTRHRLAIIGLVVLGLLYFVALFAEFFATQDIYRRDSDHLYAPPQRIRFIGEDGLSLRPFVYPWRVELDVETFRNRYAPDTSRKAYLRIFAPGDEYELWGLFPTRIHLLGVDEGTLFLMGADKFGRDIYSRACTPPAPRCRSAWWGSPWRSCSAVRSAAYPASSAAPPTWRFSA